MPPDAGWYDPYNSYDDLYSETRFEEPSAKPEVINGLVVMYPNISHIPEEETKEYLEKLSEDNDDLIDIYLQSGFSVIWLPSRKTVASHFEVWPLQHSKKKLFTLWIDRSLIPETHQIDYFVNSVKKAFQKDQADLMKSLSAQGFDFSWRPTNSSSRIIIY